jgi:hypothetical protein
MDLGRTRVIGHFRPSRFDSITIGREFAEFCDAKGFDSLETALRDPDWHSQPRNFGDGISFGQKFHHDQVNGLSVHILMWSNVLPTCVKLADGTLLHAQPGDVVLVDNDRDTHRMPEGAQGSERWFVRALAAPRGKGRELKQRMFNAHVKTMFLKYEKHGSEVERGSDGN